MAKNKTGRSPVREHTIVTDPDLYDVLLLNDDFTTMEFVVAILMNVFYKTAVEATEIMLKVHNEGQGVAGTYVLDIARSKMVKAQAAAREANFPLRLKLKLH